LVANWVARRVVIGIERAFPNARNQDLQMQVFALFQWTLAVTGRSVLRAGRVLVSRFDEGAHRGAGADLDAVV
jgi:hypothetical protein